MKKGTPNHRKTYALATCLNIPLAHAVGILEMLWHHAARFTPQGDIGSLPDYAIAAAVEWKKKPNMLVEALTVTGWFDRDEHHRLILHDWPEHCERTVHKFLDYNKKTFLPIYGESKEKKRRNFGDSPPSREDKAKAEAKAKASGKKTKKNQEAEILTAELVPVETPKQETDLQKFMGVFISLGLAFNGDDYGRVGKLWKNLTDAEREAVKSWMPSAYAEWSIREKQYVPMPWTVLLYRHWERIAIVKGRDRPATKSEQAQQVAASLFEREEMENAANN